MSRYPMPVRHLPLKFSRLYSTNVGPAKGDRVVVAMSGGVDSSVAAKLLADKAYDLSAVFMRNWDTRDESGTDKGCEWERDWEDVQRVCRLLDLPCEMVDLSREYWTRVFEPSLTAWEAGATPNPDVWCNREVKFGALLDHLPSTSRTAWLATGHYALKSYSTPSLSLPPRPKLLRPLDRHKDQTYYLSSIPESSLAQALFPLGNLLKSEVRELAKGWGLPTALRPESMGICFVGEKRRFNDFLSQYISPKPGPITDLTTGHVIGTHHGLWAYTIGQGAKIPGLPQKMFVARKDARTNEIFVVPTDNEALYCKTLHVGDWAWIWADSPPPALDGPCGFRARMRFRYIMPDAACSIHRSQADPRKMVISFDQPQKAASPGQIATVWDGNWCLGCGLIEDVS